MIKDWQKLSEEELNNLSEKEVEFYKKLLYAQEGIEFPEKPKEIDSINIQPDKTVYMVSFLDDIYFEELGEAKVVIETLKKCKTLGHINKKNWSKETYFEFKKVEKKLEELKNNFQENEKEIDFLRFQLILVNF